MKSIRERFLKYISFDTKSDEESTSFPSTDTQLDFGKILVKELEEIGLENIKQDKYGYVTAEIPANAEGFYTVGFIAHMDTSPDASGKDIKPQIIENYNGKDIKIGEKILSPDEFKELKDYIGQTIITTDGTTLLGADDKAGIAEIMHAAEYIINHPEIPHGTIKIGFTPDEEVGKGVDFFDVEGFGADFAYTMDGGKIGELEYENFNAARAKIKINGKNVHPGYAKDVMVNAGLIGTKLAQKLPETETPFNASDYEGFYHLTSFTGTVEECRLTYILRDFDAENLERRKETIRKIVAEINAEYGNVAEAEIYDEYSNMVEKIKENIHVFEIAKKAFENCGVTPLVQPIRGGTDGARLSFMGLPCPNIFAGGHNFHGVYEYVPVESMEKATEIIIEICKTAKK
ncbi:MAG: peptidase T [Firmicutes bacterium]|nr:peptidase T [Bacillota bacterium]